MPRPPSDADGSPVRLCAYALVRSACACVAAVRLQLVRVKDELRSQQARLGELTRAVDSAHAYGAPADAGAALAEDALYDALNVAVGWRPVTVSSTSVALSFDCSAPALGASAPCEPVACVLRMVLAKQLAKPGDGDVSAAVDRLSLEWQEPPPAAASAASASGDGAASAVGAVRAALFEQLRGALQPEMAQVVTAAQWPAFVRRASLPLGRLRDLCAEVAHLSLRVPVRALPEPNGRGVSFSIVYSFFAARTRFVLHLLLPSTDPDEPLAWQIEQSTVPPPAAPPATTDAHASTALALPPVTLERQVSAIVEAHALGFGRLQRIHNDLTAAFTAAV